MYWSTSGVKGDMAREQLQDNTGMLSSSREARHGEQLGKELWTCSFSTDAFQQSLAFWGHWPPAVPGNLGLFLASSTAQCKRRSMSPAMPGKTTPRNWGHSPAMPS